MTDPEMQKAARDRSPSFPFISLKTAITRLVEFDKKFGRQEPTADRVYLAWGMKGDTSQAQQTLAALKAFGLIEYRGMGPRRLVAISEEGRTYLRAQQESIRKEILKRLALKPRWISFFWPTWGVDRGPDEICIDTLVLTHKFNENSAPKFLSVYDDTINFAGLSNSDKIETEQDEEEEEARDEREDTKAHQAISKAKVPLPLVDPPKRQVVPMEGERVVFTEESNPQNYLKLIASGDVDETMLEALEDYVKRQKKRLLAAFQAGIAQTATSGKKPPRSIIGSAGEDDKAAN